MQLLYNNSLPAISIDWQTHNSSGLVRISVRVMVSSALMACKCHALEWGFLQRV